MHPTILFLEDDEEVRGELSLLLGSNGYQILMAENENEAVEVLDHATKKVDLILVNQKMTSEEALDVGRRLRKHPRAGESAPVVVLPLEFDSKLEGTNEKVGGEEYKAFINTLIQGAGDAQRIKSHALRSLINDGGQLQSLLLRFIHTLFTQVAQTAACNRAHDLNQRLARWLLLSHDRLRKEEFILTHEFLSRMLGTRRAGVSVAANGLRQGGLIDYTRGRVRIKNRKGLEQASCECYGIVKADYDALSKA